MNFIETKYLLWYYLRQPKNKLLDYLGNRLNNKLNKEFELKDNMRSTDFHKEDTNIIEEEE